MEYTTNCPDETTRYSNWRAIAHLRGGQSCLLTLGRSNKHVRELYPAAFETVLDENHHADVVRIDLEQFYGVADRGRWLVRCELRHPHKIRGHDPAVLL